MPSRMTFNDARKQAWYSDLANPDVPLHKLGRNIPHGVRGHELLEMLQSINVSVQRAVWFIRVFGSNETVGFLTAHSFPSADFSSADRLVSGTNQTTILCNTVLTGHW